MAARYTCNALVLAIGLVLCSHCCGVDIVPNYDSSHSSFDLRNNVQAGPASDTDSGTNSRLFFTESTEASAESPRSEARGEQSVSFRCIHSPDKGDQDFHTVDMDMSLSIALDGNGQAYGGTYYDEHGSLRGDGSTLYCDLTASADLIFDLVADEPSEYTGMPVELTVWATYSLSESGSNVDHRGPCGITRLAFNDQPEPFYSYTEGETPRFNRWFGPDPLTGPKLIMPMGESLEVGYTYRFHITARNGWWYHPLEPTDLYVCARAEPTTLLTKLDKRCLEENDLLGPVQDRFFSPEQELKIEDAVTDGAYVGLMEQVVLGIDVGDLFEPLEPPGDTEAPDFIRVAILPSGGRDNGHLIGEGQDNNQDAYDDTPRVADEYFTQTWYVPTVFDSTNPGTTAKQRSIPVQIKIDLDDDGAYDYSFLEYVTLKNSCCKSPSARLHKISFPDAGYLTPRGILGEPTEADSGERLEVWWKGGWLPGQEIPHYELRYWRPGGPQGLRVGQCAFPQGGNEAHYLAPDDNGNGEPDCFVWVRWSSWDFGDDDGRKGYLDRFLHVYDVCRDKYSLTHLLYHFPEGCNPPVSEPPDLYTFKEACKGPFKEYDRIVKADPPLGPETEAIFDELLLDLEGTDPEAIAMGGIEIDLGDMNWDGDRDLADFYVARDAVGTCWGDTGYSTLADIDGDGCISCFDLGLMFELNRADLNDDGKVDLGDFAELAAWWLDLRCGETGGGCNEVNLNDVGSVDMADLLLFVHNWLGGVTPLNLLIRPRPDIHLPCP